MKMLFLKGLKTFTTLISRVRNPTPLIKYSKFEGIKEKKGNQHIIISEKAQIGGIRQ